MEAKVETLRNQRRKRFMTRGITFAVASGICYGLYTGFLTLAETQGVWGDWFAGTEWGNGLYVSTGGFTKEARYEADRAYVPVRLLDLDFFVRNYVETYDKVNDNDRAILPLTRVWLPA